jgi:hypothetical protein
MAQRKLSDNRLDWLYALRAEEIAALEKLDVARNTFDPNLQMEALNELQRTYIDFAFGEHLIVMGNSQYKIDYKYYSDWQNGRKIKTIHSEIEKEERAIKYANDKDFERRYGFMPS